MFFFVCFFSSSICIRVLTKDVSSVVGAPWRCGVLTTQSGTAGIGLGHPPGGEHGWRLLAFQSGASPDCIIVVVLLCVVCGECCVCCVLCVVCVMVVGALCVLCVLCVLWLLWLFLTQIDGTQCVISIRRYELIGKPDDCAIAVWDTVKCVCMYTPHNAHLQAWR